MINQDSVDPNKTLQKKLKYTLKRNVISFYDRNVEIVRKFHVDVENVFHKLTYAHYGADLKFKAAGDVIWKADESKETLIVKSDEELITLGSNIQNKGVDYFEKYKMAKSQ